MADTIRKGGLKPLNASDLAIGDEYVNRVKELSLNYNPTAPSQWYQSYGFDTLRSVTGDIVSASGSNGWEGTGGISSFSRMREIDRADDLTRLTPEQLDKKYNYYNTRSGRMRSGRDNRPTLEEFGLTEPPKLLAPDEANSQYGISGRLSWNEPVSSAVAKIQHQRKLVEIQKQSTMQRAQGFVDNAIGFTVEMAAGLVDPIGLGISVIPLFGQARYAKMGVNASRFFRGAEGGLVSSLLTEPVNYAAKTQEKADYDMSDALTNIAFGTIGGGGLFVVGGKVYDGYKALRAMSHKDALNMSVKQFSAGLDVEVEHLATKNAAPNKVYDVNPDGLPPAPAGAQINPRQPGSQPPAAPADGGFIREFAPHKPERVQTPEEKQSFFNFFKEKFEKALGKDKQPDPTKAYDYGNRIAAQPIAAALNDKKLSDAIIAAKKQGQANKVGLYVRTADGKLMLTRPDEMAGANILKIDDAIPDGPVDLNKVSLDMAKILSEHGLTASEAFGVKYKGSYKLDEDGFTHVLEIDGVMFNPEKNSKHVVFGPEDSIKNLLSEDSSAAIFADYHMQGAPAVNAYTQQGLGPLLSDLDSKYKKFAGYDETIDITQLKQTGPQAGTNKGGYYEDQKTGEQVYVKFQDINRTMNEWIAATLYRWFDVHLPDTTLVTESKKTIGIASGVKYGAKPISPEDFNKLDELTKAQFTQHFLVDVFLGNWDVVGNGPNWNMIKLPSGDVMRIDPGGALLYRAQGELKGAAFGKDLLELDTLKDPKKNPTAAAIFKLTTTNEMKDAAYRILRISEDQINGLIDTAVAHGFDKQLGENLKGTLKLRRYQLELKFKDEAERAAKDQGKLKFMNHGDASNYLKGVSDDLSKKLTDAEKNAVTGYTYTDFGNLNKELWAAGKGGKVSQKTEETAALLDAAFDKIEPLKEGLSLWRGNVHHTVFNDALQDAGIPGFNGHATPGGTTYQKISQVQGSILNFTAFTSSSFNFKKAQNFHDPGLTVMAEIHVPAGVKALMPGMLSGHEHEVEVILPRNTQFRFKQVIPGAHGGQPTIVIEAIPPGTKLFDQMPDSVALKVAEAWRNKGSNAADNSPLWYEPTDAVSRALSGTAEDVAIITKDLEVLTQQLDADLVNADPALAKILKDDLDNSLSEIAKMETSATDLHKAAQAAAVCITKGGG